MPRDPRAENDGEAVTPLTIPIHAHEVAECARQALLEFLAGASSGWGKRELAAWLVGSYRGAVVADVVLDGARARSSQPPASEPLPPARVEELVRTTRDRVLERIAWIGTRAAIIGAAVDARLVVPCVDVQGNAGWVATEKRAPLLSRVEALVAVDALVRPLDYRDRLVVCRRCRAVSFDEEARKKGECTTHRNSGVQVKRLPEVSENERRVAIAEHPTLKVAR